MSEGMDSSAVSEGKVEDQRNTSQEEQSSHNRSSNKISAVGEILEGKRAKKCVERLDLQAPKPKEKLKIGDGSGEKLGDIPRISFQINKMKPVDLKPLHAIVFDRPGKIARLKKNLRLFNGFSFDAESEQFIKRREKLLKNTHFTNSKLKVVCGVLDLEKKGTHLDLIDKILNFLIAPKSSGKRVPVKKKRKSKKKLSGDDLSTKTKKKSKSKRSSSSSNPKKSKTASKSKAIVMDSSSDDEDEEDEKAGASAETEGSDADEKQSEKEEEQPDKSEQSEEESEEEESPKSNSSKEKFVPRKSAVVKRQSTPAKKTGPPKKRARKDLSEESESDVNSEADEKPKSKKSAKPAAKTKKADSSSNSKNTNTAEDSSDDDEPLIMMIKKAPSDEQLKETVQSLLKEANLEEMTMKQICQRVYDTFPNHDLTSRKDFIKQTVKSLIT